MPSPPTRNRRAIPSDGGPGTGRGRIVARLARQVEQALGDVDLSTPQYRVLTFLAETEGAAASAVAGRLQVTPPSVTALVDGLVARALVERRPCAADRRRVEHHLTEAGRVALATADAAVDARLASVAEPLSATERQRADQGLAAWGRALDEARQAYLEGR